MITLITLVAAALFVIGVVIAFTQRNWLIAAVLIVLALILFALRAPIRDGFNDNENDAAAALIST